MSQRRDHADAYAETQILDPQTAALQVGDGDSGHFALYDEYVRELKATAATSEAATQQQNSGVRGRR